MSFLTKLPDDIEWGVLYALAYAMFFSVVVLVILLLGLLTGSDLFPITSDIKSLEFSVSLWEVFAIYWIGGALCGIALGMSRGLANSSTLGFILSSLVVGIPFFGALGIAMFGVTGWDSNDWLCMLIPWLVLSPAYGLILRSQHGGEMTKEEESGWKFS